jgi:hypothetical protein
MKTNRKKICEILRHRGNRERATKLLRADLAHEASLNAPGRLLRVIQRNLEAHRMECVLFRPVEKRHCACQSIGDA